MAITEARETYRKAILKPDDERKAILRRLAVQWHPDRQVQEGRDEKWVEFALEMSQSINEQSAFARENARAKKEIKSRSEAYAELKAALPNLVFGKVVGSVSDEAVQGLRQALKKAKEVGVSDGEIESAERVYKAMKSQVAAKRAR